MQELRDNHQVIKRMLFLGRSPGEISRVLGITTQTVSNVRNSGLMRLALKRLHSNADKNVVKVEQRIQSLLVPSLDKLEEVIRDGTLDGSLVDISDRLHVIEHAIGRGGFPSNPQVDRDRNLSAVTKTTIERVKIRALQLAAGSGQLAEVESIIVESGGVR